MAPRRPQALELLGPASWGNKMKANKKLLMPRQVRVTWEGGEVELFDVEHLASGAGRDVLASEAYVFKVQAESWASQSNLAELKI